MSRASDLHDELSARFVHNVAGPAIKGGATYAELMVLFETVQLAMLEILDKHYQVAPPVAVVLCEESLHSAIERFAGNRKKVANG